MIFKDVKFFYEKQSILNSWKHKISKKTIELLDVHVCVSDLNRYIEYLLEDTHYNVKDNVFYDPVSGFKFTVDVFCQIAVEYVREHLDEFQII